MEDECFDLEKEYAEMDTLYKLPSLEKLSEDFDVEKSIDKEPRFILREIRRVISERITAYLHLLENLINPSSSPIFILNVLRAVSQEDREKIKEIYDVLAKMQIEVMKLDLDYREEKEADFIKESFSKWQEIKKDLLVIFERFGESAQKEKAAKESRYFG